MSVVARRAGIVRLERIAGKPVTVDSGNVSHDAFRADHITSGKRSFSRQHTRCFCSACSISYQTVGGLTGIWLRVAVQVENPPRPQQIASGGGGSPDMGDSDRPPSNSGVPTMANLILADGHGGYAGASARRSELLKHAATACSRSFR